MTVMRDTNVNVNRNTCLLCEFRVSCFNAVPLTTTKYNCCTIWNIGRLLSCQKVCGVVLCVVVTCET